MNVLLQEVLGYLRTGKLVTPDLSNRIIVLLQEVLGYLRTGNLVTQGLSDRMIVLLQEVLGYLRTGKLVTQGLSDRMIEKLKLECDFFNLKGLRFQIQVAYPHPDDEIVIDARGTRIKTVRRIITKGKDNSLIEVETFSSLFDPQSPKLLQAEDDGSYKIDADPKYVEEYFLARCECESEESEDRVYGEFCDKYGFDMMIQWNGEFIKKYY